ncbi:MAG: hypothetical protein AAGF11_03070 [Myxococcota bacterium]
MKMGRAAANRWSGALAVVVVSSACRAEPSAITDTEPTAGTASAGPTEGAGEGPTDGEPPPERAVVTHSFGLYSLAPLEELQPCIQWTLHNEAPVYVQAVTMVNDGGFHHSNWFIVPEGVYVGEGGQDEDGFFVCSERGFSELNAAFNGTVLAAQSTQSRYERMELPEGVVVKVPPHYKIIAGAHLLNLAEAELDTELRVSLDIVHPRDVDVVAVPFRLSYYDLAIPPFTEVRYSAACNFSNAYESAADEPLDLKLYHVLPHYHYLGNYFDLSVLGGPTDGQSVYRLEGFNADANGQAYAQPVDLSGAEGFRFSCGYDNWTDQTIGWGIGSQEMCVMLGLADSSVIIDGSIPYGSGQVVGTEGEVLLSEGPCHVVGIRKTQAQSLPDPAELERPLYVPPFDPADVGLPPSDPCVDVPDDVPVEGLVSLARVRDTLFVSTCQFSSCHAGSSAAAGLDLAAAELHTELMEHEVQADTALPLVAPGDPAGSWLYRLVAECEPTDRSDRVVDHMPLNSPQLSDPGQVALLRAWIASGASDN